MHLDISVCTWSGYDPEGFLGVQVGALAEGAHGIPPGHHLSCLGLDARPVDPEKRELGALALRLKDGHQEFELVLNDMRTEAALPNLNKGATRLFDTGTYQGFPFHFTETLDPVTNELEIKAWRAGGKVRIRNLEGLVFEISGTTVTITGATSVKAGGEEQLTKFTPLATALADVGSALTAIAASTVEPYSPKLAASKAVTSIGAFATGGSTLITKGA